MQIRTEGETTEALYKLLTGSVAPRPIAWVTTISPEGLCNAAPFSAYTFVCNNPPMLLINVGRSDRVKDTARNIRETGCFVVNVAVREHLEAMNASSAPYPADMSETDDLGIGLAPSALVAAPRIKGSPVNMECRLERIIDFGEEGSQSIIGRVVMWHIDDDLYEDGKIDQQRLNPVGRIGGAVYACLGELIPMPAPYLPGGWKPPR
jgi:flavin reductase (DIM6/NTAB) family NADH-FMN oxidoreductase RutF